jgi:hypothetical protein
MAKFLSQFHHPEGFPVSLGIGLAEISGNPHPRRATLLMSNERHGPLPVKSETGNQGRIVTGPAVTMKFNEIFREGIQIIKRVGTLGMTGNLNEIQRRQI